jgi:hypothetical protein
MTRARNQEKTGDKTLFCIILNLKRTKRRHITEYITHEQHAFIILTPDEGHWMNVTSQPFFSPPQAKSP